MAFVRKGDASWARKLRPEHARQHRAEGGFTSPPGPSESERAERQRISNEHMAAIKQWNTSLPTEPYPPLKISGDD